MLASVCNKDQAVAHFDRISLDKGEDQRGPCPKQAIRIILWAKGQTDVIEGLVSSYTQRFGITQSSDLRFSDCMISWCKSRRPLMRRFPLNISDIGLQTSHLLAVLL
jgi:hypothetical protein